MACATFTQKTFDFMTPVKIKVNKLTGKKWEENDLQKKFPTICKLFNYEL